MLHSEKDKKLVLQRGNSDARSGRLLQRRLVPLTRHFLQLETNSKTRPRNPAFALIVGCLRPAFPERESLSLSFSLSVAANPSLPPRPTRTVYIRITLRNRVTPAAATHQLSRPDMNEWLTPRYVHAHNASAYRFSSTVCSLVMYRRRRRLLSLSHRRCSHLHQQVENYGVSNFLRVFV